MSRRLVSLLGCALFASLLRCAKDPTGFFVTVTVPATVRFLEVKVFDRSMVSSAPPVPGAMQAGQLDLERSTTPLGNAPHTFVVSRTGNKSRIMIEVVGLTTNVGPGAINSPYDRITVTFEDDALYDVPMTLRSPCAGLTTPCPAPQHCSASGACEDYEPRNLTRHSW